MIKFLRRIAIITLLILMTVPTQLVFAVGDFSTISLVPSSNPVLGCRSNGILQTNSTVIRQRDIDAALALGRPYIIWNPGLYCLGENIRVRQTGVPDHESVIVIDDTYLPPPVGSIYIRPLGAVTAKNIPSIEIGNKTVSRSQDIFVSSTESFVYPIFDFSLDLNGFAIENLSTSSARQSSAIRIEHANPNKVEIYHGTIRGFLNGIVADGGTIVTRFPSISIHDLAFTTIRDSAVYFVLVREAILRDNRILDSGSAFGLNSIEHAIIERNAISLATNSTNSIFLQQMAITLFSTDWAEVNGNTIRLSTQTRGIQYGIYGLSVISSTIHHNTIQNTRVGAGIVFQFGENNLIQSNQIFSFASGCGFGMTGAGRGIVVNDQLNIGVRENTLMGPFAAAIEVLGNTTGVIERNHLYLSSPASIRNLSSGTVVQNNDINDSCVAI